MHGHGSHIRTGFHGVYRKIFPKIKVGSMGLIHQHQHIVFMGKPYDALKVGTDSIVGGIVYQHAHGIGIVKNGLL